MSWQSALLNTGLRLLIKRNLARRTRVEPATAVASRRNLERLQDRIPVPPPEARHESVTIGSVPGEWVRWGSPPADRALLYLHGGAYAVGSARLYRDFTWRLARASGLALLAIDYRLAPENPFPAALDDARRAYAHLLDSGLDPGRVVIGGDSAGGGLVLATLLAERDAGHPLPAAAACLSPWTDLAGGGASIQLNSRSDAYLVAHLLRGAGRLYAGRTDLREPLVSPLAGTLKGLPPLFLHVSDSEILFDDTRRLAARARAAGVPVQLRVWHKQPHVFHLFARVLPEGRQGIDEMGAFLSRHAAGAD